MNRLSADVILGRMLLAALLGAAIGLEREYRHKPAGLRTNVLIALGSALYSAVSMEFGPPTGTPDRIAAQIVTGIGQQGQGMSQQTKDNLDENEAGVEGNADGKGAGKIRRLIMCMTMPMALIVIIRMSHRGINHGQQSRQIGS